MRLLWFSVLWCTVVLLASCGAPAQVSEPTVINTDATRAALATTPTLTPLPTRTPGPSPTIDSDFDAPILEVAGAAPTSEPTPTLVGYAHDQPVRLVIDSINLDRPLINVGLDENYVPIVPKHDVGWYHYSARPGGGENVVLWGHVLRFVDTPDTPAPFARLSEVTIGDRITLYNASGQSFTYVVNDLIWATPDQVQYILPHGSEMLTLVSCIGDTVIEEGSVSMTHRLITRAVPEAEAAIPSE